MSCTRRSTAAMSELDHKLGCFSVIHMDPVDTKNERLAEMREETVQLLRSIDPVLSLHDFRMVPGKHRTNLVFDVLVPFGYKLSDEDVRKAVRARPWRSATRTAGASSRSINPIHNANFAAERTKPRILYALPALTRREKRGRTIDAG